MQNNGCLNVIYGQKADSQLLAGKRCPTCYRFVNPEDLQDQYNRAVKRALGILPEDGETRPPRPARHSETEVPAGAETTGGYRINREPDTVVEAHVVIPAPPPIPPRPSLPPREPEANLKVITHQSIFHDWKEKL